MVCPGKGFSGCLSWTEVQGLLLLLDHGPNPTRGMAATVGGTGGGHGGGTPIARPASRASRGIFLLNLTNHCADFHSKTFKILINKVHPSTT